jgi:ketosteroid isomerase-like protein
MLPHDPEDWPSLFAQHLNAGDLDEVMSLYEPDARFVAPSGETLVGRDRIGEVLPRSFARIRNFTAECFG